MPGRVIDKPNLFIKFEMRSSTFNPPKPKTPSHDVWYKSDWDPGSWLRPRRPILLPISSKGGLITAIRSRRITPDHESKQVLQRLAGSAPSRGTLETPWPGRQVFVVARGRLSESAPPELFGDSADYH
jgi:hypothetical protein